MLKKKLEKIAYRRLFQQLSQKSRTVSPYKIEDAKRIGILWNKDDNNASNEIQKILKELKQPNRFIHTLAYSKDPKELATSSAHHAIMVPQSIKWTGEPKNADALEFIHTSFDILIDLSMEHNLPLIYALALNNSRFKVSSNIDLYQCADFFIQTPSKEISKLFSQMKDYISKF
ncbi:MAG: DUF6913 domain-containing protein [Prolixibacteraceae bacterium]|jgi:hypothetical protein|nr:hypothetical protein [Prolixibacteraceae bacterium]